MEAASKKNSGRRGGLCVQAAIPNEYLIQLEASAIRMKWSPLQERIARGCVVDGVAPRDASRELCTLLAYA